MAKFLSPYSVAQLDGSPRRDYYTGANLDRALSIADLRARSHKLMPRFVLEYLEAGAEDETTLNRERAAFEQWLFLPRTLVDVSGRTLSTNLLGRPTPMPAAIAPTGLNGLFRHRADVALAQGAASVGIPFIQSAMSTDPMEAVSKVSGLRHWWQVYVFGGEEIWQELADRAEKVGCEALVLTTNAQIFGNRDWDRRTRTSRTMLSVSTMIDAALHPRWWMTTAALRKCDRLCAKGSSGLLRQRLLDQGQYAAIAVMEDGRTDSGAMEAAVFHKGHPAPR